MVLDLIVDGLKICHRQGIHGVGVNPFPFGFVGTHACEAACDFHMETLMFLEHAEREHPDLVAIKQYERRHHLVKHASHTGRQLLPLQHPPELLRRKYAVLSCITLQG